MLDVDVERERVQDWRNPESWSCVVSHSPGPDWPRGFLSGREWCADAATFYLVVVVDAEKLCILRTY